MGAEVAQSVRALARTLEDAATPSRKDLVVASLVALLATVAAVLLFSSLGFPRLPIAAAFGTLAVIMTLTSRYRLHPRLVVERLTSLPAALARTLAPLLLTVVMLVLYATRALGEGSQVAVGVLFVFVLTLVLGREWDGTRKGWATVKRWVRRPDTFGAPRYVAALTALVVVPALPLLAFVVLLVTPSRVEELGGLSAALELGAFVLLLVAAVMRLITFASHAWWRQAVLLFALVPIGGLLISWGYLPGGDGSEFVLSDSIWLLILVGILLAGALVEAGREFRMRERKAALQEWPQLVGNFGLLCAFAAAAWMAVAIG